MNKAELLAFKEWKHDEIQQAKPWYKRVKRLTLYKDNQPIKFNYNNKLK